MLTSEVQWACITDGDAACRLRVSYVVRRHDMMHAGSCVPCPVAQSKQHPCWFCTQVEIKTTTPSQTDIRLSFGISEVLSLTGVK